MVVTIDRRTFLVTTAAVVTIHPCHAQDPYTWGWVALKLCEGAIAYVGGRLLAKALGEPSNADIISAIRTAIMELEKSLKADYRKAITEDRIKELQARAASIQLNLSRYAIILPQDRPRYRNLLQQSDIDTSYGISLSKQYGVAALPVFAIFVTLRNYVIAAFAEIDRDRGPLYAYRKELSDHANYLINQTNEYYGNLKPSRRLGDIECLNRPGGGGRGFQVSTYYCRFSEDGAYNNSNFSCIMNDDQSVTRAIIKQKHNQRTAELSKFMAEQKTGLIFPLVKVVTLWRQFRSDLVIRKGAPTARAQ